MSRPSLREDKMSPVEHHKIQHRSKSVCVNNEEAQRRVIFPYLYPKLGENIKHYDSEHQKQQQQPAVSKDLQQPIKQSDAQDRGFPRHGLERSLSFPKDGLKQDIQQYKKIEMLPLPKLPELKPKPTSQMNVKRGVRIRDSTCVRKAVLPSVPLSDEHDSTPLSRKKGVSQSPQIASLSLERRTSSNRKTVGPHRTYYPAASIPCYHEPPTQTTPSPKPLSSILRTTSSESIGVSTRLRSSIIFRKSSTVLISPCGDITLSPTEQCIPPTSCLTLASPTSIRSLSSEIESEDGHHEIGETESDLNRITIPLQKVIPRQNSKLRRNASDTVVANSEEEVQQRRRKSINIQDEKVLLEDGVTRHESLECLPSHKQISFDPHIWVYEYNDDRHEFERNGGKWFTEDELDQFKEDAIQRIRSRNMRMMSAGQGRIVMIPRDRNQTASPEPVLNENRRSVAFTHPALGFDDEFDLDVSICSRIKKSKEAFIHDALSREMRNILVVDPHDIFLTLFSKCFAYIIPHVSIATARSAEEAMSRIQAAQKAFPVTDGGAVHGFDIIIVEERLGPINLNVHDTISQCAGDDSTQRQRKVKSGSALIQSIFEEEQAIRERVGSMGASEQSSIRFSLLIGVSACLVQDEAKLKSSGADIVFGKPPPEMNSELRNDLLKILMTKRNNDCSLFD